MADKPEGTVEPHVEKTSPADKKSKKDKKAKKEGKEVHQKEKPKADPDQPQKSKAELRAERRAKQVCIITNLFLRFEQFGFVSFIINDIIIPTMKSGLN